MGGGGGHTYMGWWGNMGGPKQKGIVTYVLSPFEQNPMKGMLQSAVFNGSRRVRSQILYIGMPLALIYGVYTWGRETNHFMNSKEGRLLHGDDDE